MFCTVHIKNHWGKPDSRGADVHSPGCGLDSVGTGELAKVSEALGLALKEAPLRQSLQKQCSRSRIMENPDHPWVSGDPIWRSIS